MAARNPHSVRSIRRRTARGPVLAARVLLVAALAAGCGSSGEAPATPAPPPESPSAAPPESSSPVSSDAAGEIVITISEFSYDVPDAVPAGATVTVVNKDGVAHTVTSSPQGDFDVNVAGGATGTFTAPDTAGEYAIICIFHSTMSGTLVVT